MLIGISGKAGHGKDEVAKEIMEFWNEVTWEILRFADPIKQIVSIMLNCDITLLEDRDFKKSTLFNSILTPRDLFTMIGTEIGRKQLDDDIWVNYTLDPAKIDGKDIIIPDVRFKNEATGIRNSGGILIRVIRPDVESSEHISETDLDDWSDWDIVITNDGNLLELGNAVAQALWSKFYNTSGTNETVFKSGKRRTE